MTLSANPYDPDEPEGPRSSSTYVSRKDVRWVALIVVVLAILLFPLFLEAKRNAERTFCSQNMRAIGQAMLGYATDNNDRLPPAYNEQANGAPALVDGFPVTWATQVREYMTPRQNFVCPTSRPEERARVLSFKPGEKSFEVTYGLYRGVASVSLARVSDPASVVAVAETANNGALGSFNPQPFVGEDGQRVPYDAFLIGWDDDNMRFSPASRRVTRLAAYGAPDGDTSRSGVRWRHETFIHAISVSGGLVRIGPGEEKVRHFSDELQGPWAANPLLYR